MLNRIRAGLTLTLVLSLALMCVRPAIAEEPMVPLVGQHGTNFDLYQVHAAPPAMRLSMGIYLDFRNRAEMEALNIGGPPPWWE